MSDYSKKDRSNRLYRIWQCMKTRCNNPNSDKYKFYGGRGIRYTSRWESFDEFRRDLVNTYEDGLSLDRINNDGNYEPNNCRWATQKEQCNNRRKNRLITMNGGTKTLAQWLDNALVKRSTADQRFHSYGWSLEETITLKTYERRRKLI